MLKYLYGASQVALVVKSLLTSTGDLRDSGLIPGAGRSPGGEHGNPLQYSCQENPVDRGAWLATVHRVAKSWTWLKRLSTAYIYMYMNILGRDWGQEEKGTTEDEMAGWHHRLNGHGFGWTPGVGDGQGGLACCNSWGCKESRLSNWTELNV